MKYQVEEVAYTQLVLDATHKERQLIEVGNKKVVGTTLPRVGSNTFVYDKVNKYRFGCDSGRFSYADLLAQIAAANVEVKQQDALLPIKGGSPVTTEIVEESDKYYILKNGKALLKSNYTKGKTNAKNKEAAFGKFKYSKDGWGDSYYYWGQNRAGNKKADILEAMLQAKAIIDFLEGKGDYAEKATELVAESNTK